MDDQEELEEGEPKIDDDMDMPPEGMGDDFGLDDPNEDHYH